MNTNTINKNSERTALLSSSLSTIPTSEYANYDKIISPSAITSHVDHAKWLIQKCTPLLITSLLHQVIKWIIIISAGHLGPVELGAIALAHVFENLSSKLTAWSFRNALSTLCSQAWTGAENKSLVGVYLQRGYVLYFLMNIPIGVIWACSGYIFKLLKQDQDVSQSTETYLLYQFPGYIAHGCYVLLMGYLQTQGVMQATVFVLTLSLPLHLAFNYILVYYINLGIVGISLGLTLYYFATLGLLALYAAKIEGYHGWGGWSRQCLQEWSPILRYYLPASVGSLWGMISEAVITFSVSYLGNTELAAQAILLRSSLTLFAPGRALKNVLATRIGNQLGIGSPNDARRAYFVGGCIGLVLGIFYTLVLMVCQNSYAYMFTSDDNVAAAVSSVIPVFAVTQTVDMFRSLTFGVLQGVGRQKELAIISFLSDFVFALPLCYIFTFRLNGGLIGLWSGIACGYFVTAIVQILYIFVKIDWIIESERARKCIAVQQDKLNDRTARRNSLD
ncbi:mate-domain-containing protein [Circinella umbellata]|nr:mate-domain-containing protein [Circinella umbellata]